MGISVLPSLDEIAREPQRLDGLDLITLSALALRANAVAGAIATRLLVHTAGKPAEARVEPPADDRLLKPAEAAVLLRVTPRWIYRNAAKLPFVRRVGPRALLCSERGLKKYLARRQAC